jgi:hypothetical protein
VGQQESSVRADVRAAQADRRAGDLPEFGKQVDHLADRPGGPPVHDGREREGESLLGCEHEREEVGRLRREDDVADAVPFPDGESERDTRIFGRRLQDRRLQARDLADLLGHLPGRRRRRGRGRGAARPAAPVTAGCARVGGRRLGVGGAPVLATLGEHDGDHHRRHEREEPAADRHEHRPRRLGLGAGFFLPPAPGPIPVVLVLVVPLPAPGAVLVVLVVVAGHERPRISSGEKSRAEGARPFPSQPERVYHSTPRAEIPFR